MSPDLNGEAMAELSSRERACGHIAPVSDRLDCLVRFEAGEPQQGDPRERTDITQQHEEDQSRWQRIIMIS